MRSIASVFYRLVLVTLAFVPPTACALSGGPLKGRVLEAGTERPIAGAIVIARWQGYLASFAHGRTVCVHVESTVTDANGAYRVPAWRKPSDIGWVQDLQPHVFAYKKGYQFVRISEDGNVQYLELFTGSREERFKYLERIFGSTGCSTNDESKENIIPFVRAVYDEAKGIVQSQEEKRMLEFFLYGLEDLELGFDEAQRRHLERVNNKR